MQWWVAVRLHQPLVAHSQWEHWQVHKSSWQRAQKSELHSTHSNNKKKNKNLESGRSRSPCRSRSGCSEPKYRAASINCREPQRQLNTLPLCSAATTVSRKEESRKRVPLKFTEIKADKGSSSPETDKVPESRLNDLRATKKKEKTFRAVQCALQRHCRTLRTHLLRTRIRKRIGNIGKCGPTFWLSFPYCALHSSLGQKLDLCQL